MPTVIVLGLIAVGLYGITVADNTAPHVRPVAAPTVKHLEANAAGAATALDDRLPAADRVSPAPNGAISMYVSTPRQCKLDQGIVDDCTFE